MSIKRKITNYFGLSYTSWLVMPRVLLEEMPIKWQEKMTKILDEFDEVFDRDKLWKDGYPFIRMKSHDTGKFVSLQLTKLPHYRHPQKNEVNYFKK